MSFQLYRQPDQMDCGPTCLRMIAKHHGKSFSLQKLREISGISRDGVSLLGISEAAEKIGFRTLGASFSLKQLSEIDLPVILHWNQNHFVVLYKISSGSGVFSDKNTGRSTYHIADPARGMISYSEKEFKKHWLSTVVQAEDVGVALTLETTPNFHSQISDTENGLSLTYILGYLRNYKQLILQLFLALGIGSMLQSILPFLTQSIVDTGINTRNLNFVFIILIAQTMLLIGRMSVEFIRSWILLHISTRINISILTDFIIKLLNLPMGFFDSK